MAADLTGEARESYLAGACAEDPELLSEVTSLLEHHDQAGTFLQASAQANDLNSPPVHQPIFLPGQLIADRFQMLKFIGRGGMGEVYQARDQRLNETIAIKAIRPEALSDVAIARFKQETLLARRITHPNVCRVFDLEQHRPQGSAEEILFLTMEFVEGETLAEAIRGRGRMKTSDALPILAQIARALAASHKAGIIHRDLKPSNVILASGDTSYPAMRAVVTDFGVAKILSRPDAGTDPLTGEGQVIGTASYMAPEQIEGGTITPATDVYALGLIMYEVLAGARPFSQTGPFSSMAERLKGLPPSPRKYAPALGLRLESLILSCLAVRPGQRIQDVGVVARSIEELIEHPSRTTAVYITPEQQPRLSIAVLPFVNMSRDPDNDYFSDGLTEELMGSLAKLEGLRVVARTSAFRFRDTNLDIRDVARQLTTDFLVEGAVRRSGDRLRVTVRLIKAEEGSHIWDERYDRQMIDVLSMQEEIANTVAGQLKMKLRVGEESHFMGHRTQNIEAYENFLKGRFFWNKRTHSNLQKAEECFQQAMKHDPGFAAALAALADCYVVQGMYAAKPPHEIFPLAKDLVLKALALDPKLAEAHCAAGYIHAIYDWDWTAAERAFGRALELNPNYATAHQWYAILCLMPQLRFAEARSQLQLARENDPLSVVMMTAAASGAYHEHRHDDAIRESLKVLEMDPNFGLARLVLGQAHAGKHLHTDAIAHLKLAADHAEKSPMVLGALGYSLGIAGFPQEARALLDELTQRSSTQYVSPVPMAQISIGMQKNDDALQYLENALELRAAELTSIGLSPIFDGIRATPRFSAICRRVGLPDRA